MEKVLDILEDCINHRLVFNPKGNRYILAANEIMYLYNITDRNVIFELAVYLEDDLGYNRDTLLRNDGLDIVKNIRRIVKGYLDSKAIE